MSITASLTLMSNGTGTGSQFQWPGGRGFFDCLGTFGGGSVALQYLQANGTTWKTPTNGSLTAAGEFEIALPPGPVRVVATTATAVYARLSRIPE